MCECDEEPPPEVCGSGAHATIMNKIRLCVLSVCVVLSCQGDVVSKGEVTRLRCNIVNQSR